MSTHPHTTADTPHDADTPSSGAALRFSKMHGLGNDFMVIDALHQTLPPLPATLVQQWAHRHTGIGFDQLLIVEPARQPGVDFRYRILNADGSEVNQCGNGARCFARFVREHRLTDKDTIRVETAAGLMALQIQPDGQVTVDMGAPRFAPADIPLRAHQQAPTYILVSGQHAWEVSAVSLGNPHCVLLVENTEHAPVADVGPQLESHPDFPERANVGFMQIIDRTHIRLRVYERGAGETLACGSGACAAVVCGQQRGLLDDAVTVTLPGGDLHIHYNGEGGVQMTGPAQSVYDGVITLPADLAQQTRV